MLVEEIRRAAHQSRFKKLATALETEHHKCPRLAEDKIAQGRQRLVLDVDLAHLDDHVSCFDHATAPCRAALDDFLDDDLRGMILRGHE